MGTIAASLLPAWIAACAGPDSPGAPLGTPARRTAARIELSGAVLFVPGGAGPSAGRIDLFLHFHGAPEVVGRAFSEAGCGGVLIAVSRRGLSGVYEREFSDPAPTERLLAEGLESVRVALRSPEVEWGRIAVSSFSAGYGAIRALLSRRRGFERASALLLADSLHAGYDESRAPRASQMAPFRAFARAAARGEKVFWSTHTALAPGDYASTTETNDDLIAAVGGGRRLERGAFGPLEATSRFDLGGFHVVGCAGEDGAALMRHLQAIGELFARAGADLARRGGAGGPSGARADAGTNLADLAGNTYRILPPN